MYTELASKLSVPATTQYSQAVSMAGANAVQVEVTVLNKSGSGTLDVTVEGSNDLENWGTADMTAGTTLQWTTTDIGYLSGKWTGIAYQFVRLKYVMSANTAIISAGINTASL